MMNQVDEVGSEIRERIKLALGVILEGDEQHFFMEGGVDSLAFLNVLQWLEKKYGIKFVNDTLPDLVTSRLLAGAVVELVQKKARGGG